MFNIPRRNRNSKSVQPEYGNNCNYIRNTGNAHAYIKMQGNNITNKSGNNGTGGIEN